MELYRKIRRLCFYELPRELTQFSIVCSFNETLSNLQTHLVSVSLI